MPGMRGGSGGHDDRMTRRLLNVLTSLALLLCVAVVALWVMSFRHADAIKYSDGQTSWVVASGRAGLLAWAYGDGMSKDWPGWHRWRGEPDTVLGTAWPPPGRLGFALQFFRWKADSPSLRGSVLCPHWFAATPLALFVGRRLRRVRSTRVPPGTCPTCGYNLTGNVSGVCPECGKR